MITHVHRLDVVPDGAKTVVRVNQYDEDFNILFHLYAREGEFAVESGTTAAIRGTKPDGNGYSATCTLTVVTEDGEDDVQVLVAGHKQMTAAAGLGEFEITLYKSDQELSTANFTLSIERAALDKDTPASTSVVRELVNVMDRADEIINAGQQYEDSQHAMEELTARSEAAASAAEESQTAAAQTLADIQAEYESESADLARTINAAEESIEEKRQTIASLVVTSNQTAAEALNKASNVENDVADVATDVARMEDSIQSLETSRASHLANLTVINGALYGINEEGDIITDPIEGIGGGGGGGGSSAATSVITITNTSGFNGKTIADGDSMPLSISWSSVESEMPTGNGSLRILVNNVLKATLNDVAQGEVTVDVAPYLTAGSNTVRMTVVDMYDNSRYTAFQITVVAISLSSTFDSTTAYEGAITYPCTPTGTVQKTIHGLLDGREIITQTTSVSGRQMSFTIPQQSHGAHTLEFYFDCQINGQTVESNHLYHEIICIEPLNNTVIITSSYNKSTVEQYTTIQLPFSVYDPRSLTAEVKIYDGEDLLTTQTVDRTEQSYSYRCNDYGEKTIKLVSGGTTKTIQFTVTESDIDVEAETDSLVLYLSAQGRSNNEENPGTWTYQDIAATFSGFNFASDGWQTDAEGITVLRVSGNARVTIPYKLFGTDFRQTGKTIEIEFATRNVLDYDTPILSCMSGGRGLSMTAQQATLISEQSTVTTQYKEDEHVRLTFVAQKRTEDRLLMLYVNGIPSGVVQYPPDDDFAQISPVNISIGSGDCTIDLYCIRVYDNNLTRHQVLDNWIADTQIGAEMLARYTHNNVYDAYGAIVTSRLPSNLGYFVFEAEELPQYKGDKKTVKGSYVDPVYPTKSFTFDGCEMDVQGTSSAPYARKNYDLKFKGGFEMRSGHETSYELATGVIPFNRFVIKADVASSEGANNVELVKLYNDICPYKTPEMEADPRVRWGIYGFPIVVFWYDTMTETTTFMGKYNFNLPKRAPEPYGYSGELESWEFQNNTSDRMLFKSADFDADYTDPETGETYKAWRNDFEARFPSDEWTNTAILKEFVSFIVSTDRDQATGDDLDSSVTYDGVQYTTDSSAYRLAKFKAEFASYAELDSFIFYYIFTELFLMVDSRAKNLFIGFNGSPVTASGRVATRKATAQPYDMDTGLGTNNEGSLVFGYGLEDTDHLGVDTDIFNGQNSVLWCNLRDAFRAEIVQMYKTLRSSGGLSYAEVQRRYEEHQSKWPEAIWIEDAWFKYIDPLIAPDPGKEPTAVYLPMMQGSKAEQRKWWLINRFKYMDSKWNAGDALAQVIQLRGYAKADITVTPYADIYPTIKYASYLVQERGQHDVPTTLACPIDTLNDTEIYIYSAPQLASIGDLAPLKVGLVDISMATRLQSLKIGDSSASYSNTNLYSLSLGSNVLLKTIDARNCSGLGDTTQEGHTQTSVDISGCEIVEEVYFDGTKIQGLTLPNGGVLRVLHLPATMTNLTILNQRNITDLTVAGYSNITTLRIENSSVDERAILEQIPAAARVRLTGIAWEAEDAEEIESLFDLLDTMRGLDESGNNTDTAQVAGTIHTASLTGAEISAFNARYPYIRVTADSVKSYLTYKSWDDGSELDVVTCLNGIPQGPAPSNPTRTSTAQYDYTFVGWSTSTDSQTAQYPAAGPTSGMEADTVLYAAYSRTVRTYTVTWKNSNGTTLETDTNVPYGSTPQYNGATPVNPVSGGGSFKGWTPAISSVTGNVTYTASYVTMYDVKFYNGSTLLDTVSVAEGGTAVYSGSTPVSSEDSTLEFLGWTRTSGGTTVQSDALTNVTANRNVYAVFASAVEDVEISDSWDTIIANIDNGTYKTKYKLGNYKSFDWNNNPNDPVVAQIVGIDVDELSDGSGYAPLTFILKKLYPAKTAMNNSASVEGGWENSSLRNLMKNTLKQQIPETIRSRICNVNKVSKTASGTQTTVDDVWIPSMHEVGLSNTIETSGVSYSSVFKNNEARIKPKWNGGINGYQWWLRSVNDSADKFYAIGTGGEMTGFAPNTQIYTTIGFCLGLEPDTITDSWDDIITNIGNGTYSTKYAVGDTKTLDLGTEGKIKMQLVAKDTDDLADGSGKAPTTWISQQLIATSHRMNPAREGSSGAYTEGTGTIGGWEKTEMRSWLKETVKPLIPANVLAAIKPVTKYSQICNTSSKAVNNVTSTEDVWIPSAREVGFTGYETEGPTYTGLFTANADRIKSKTGASSASWWWTRSANISYNFRNVSSDGSYGNNDASNSGAVVLGFCL